MNIISTSIKCLLLTIAVSRIAETNAITRPQNSFLSPETRGAASGLSVDEEGNLYSSLTRKTSLFQSSRTVSHRRKGASIESSTPKQTRAVSIEAASSLRGGDLCVDDDGNFYSSSVNQRASSKDKSSLRQGRAFRDSSSSSPVTDILRGGAEVNDRSGDLCVDEDGNFYSSSKPSSASVTRSLKLRGGSLMVDIEGNFFSPEPVVGRRRVGKSSGIVSTHRRKGEFNRGLETNRVLLVKDKLIKKQESMKAKESSSTAPCRQVAFMNCNNSAMMKT